MRVKDNVKKTANRSAVGRYGFELDEIKKLVATRRRDVLKLVRAFRKLAPAKIRNYGLKVEYFVSILEASLRETRRRK